VDWLNFDASGDAAVQGNVAPVSFEERSLAVERREFAALFTKR
jgi:hypothetical protein